MRVAMVTAVAIILGLTIGAAPASAHAVIVSSNPEADGHVAKPPKDVSIVFSEPVSISLGGLTVLDSSGRRVDTGKTRQPQPQTIRADLVSGLKNGTYVANYAIISADGHAIRGSIIFGVGKGELGDVSGLSQRTNPWLDFANKAGQFLTYLGVMAAAGLAFFCGFVAEEDTTRRRLARSCRWFVGVTAAGIALTVATQAALESGNGLSSAIDATVLRAIGGQGLGWQTALQAVGLVACLFSLTKRRTILSQVLALYGGLVATGSLVVFGHALQSSNPWLTAPADVVHVAVAAVWLGGLIGLTVVLRRQSVAIQTVGTPAKAGPVLRSTADTRSLGTDGLALQVAGGPGGTTLLEREEVATTLGGNGHGDGSEEDRFRGGRDEVSSFDGTLAVVGRFSTAAAISVVLLGVAGLVLGVVQVGSLRGLFTTSYGQLLLVKLAVVAVILAMAGFNRYRLLPALGIPAQTRQTSTSADVGQAADRSENDRHRWQSLRRVVVFEAIGIVAVLALTAALANTPTSASLPPKPVPFSAHQRWDSGSVRLNVTPNAAGANSFSVQFVDAAGKPTDPVAGVSVYLKLPSEGVGPLNKNLTKVGPGHFTLDRASELSIPGRWTITLQVRVRDFDQRNLDFTDNVT
jgi:copper transport protein